MRENLTRKSFEFGEKESKVEKQNINTSESTRFKSKISKW